MSTLPADPYNPLDKRNLGKSVAEALLDSPARPLGGLTPFDGAGIYALYHVGRTDPYSIMGDVNRPTPRWPIYVGKAIPSGGRKGIGPLTVTTGRFLHARLKEHAESVTAASNLDISDFQCRYLAVDDIWIPLGETMLIDRFRPVWNLKLDGFGNHDPGSGRYRGLRPLWDVLHPGRAWALRCEPRLETQAELSERVADFLRGTAPTSGHMDFGPRHPSSD